MTHCPFRSSRQPVRVFHQCVPASTTSERLYQITYISLTIMILIICDQPVLIHVSVIRSVMVSWLNIEWHGETGSSLGPHYPTSTRILKVIYYGVCWSLCCVFTSSVIAYIICMSVERQFCSQTKAVLMVKEPGSRCDVSWHQELVLVMVLNWLLMTPPELEKLGRAQESFLPSCIPQVGSLIPVARKLTRIIQQNCWKTSGGVNGA